MKTLGAALVVLLGASSAFSLGEINCSSATGDLKRVEKETWGANHIWWEMNGIKLEESTYTVSMHPRTRRQIDGDRKNGHYIIEASIAFNDEAREPMTRWVLCQKWSNNALD